MFTEGFSKISQEKKKKSTLRNVATGVAVGGGAALGAIKGAKAIKRYGINKQRLAKFKTRVSKKFRDLDIKASDMSNYRNLYERQADIKKGSRIGEHARKFGLNLQWS